MRHVVVFLVVYSVLVCLMPPMERELLFGSPSQVLTYARLQNMGKIRINVLKAACMACIWPFAVHAGPQLFVELGGFSMACFAIACRADVALVERMTRKRFWHRILRAEGGITPRLIAVCDSRARVRVIDPLTTEGVRKPDRGMYAMAVRRERLRDFCATPKPDDMLQEEVKTFDGVPGKSYRLCTFLCARGVRVVSLFVMSLSDATVPPRVWRRLFEYGACVLAELHGRRFGSVPLVGWDLMHREDDAVVVLEGNPGGSLGMHIVPFACQIGAVSSSIATTWLADLRDAHAAGLYDKGAGVCLERTHET